MGEQQIRLAIGSLLHDIGKVTNRVLDSDALSENGYLFLRESASIDDSEILDCVRYHYSKRLTQANIASNALVYITHFSDCVASALDHNDALKDEEIHDGTVPLRSIFNILNNNHGDSHYAQQILNASSKINYPTEEPVVAKDRFYQNALKRVQNHLLHISLSREYVNSLLVTLETTLSFLPSSTCRNDQEDISLYDHVKMTTAISECMYQYLQERKIVDLQYYFCGDDTGRAWDDQAFILYSIDFSGIQGFIYTTNAISNFRALQARSFYLNILMEHVVDEILDELMLSRSCLIYSGGGHCYMLLPNTKYCIDVLCQQNKIVNEWFIEQFGVDLYAAHSYVSCSANTLRNHPKGSYRELFLRVSQRLSECKSSRYNAGQILYLNERYTNGNLRQCSVCRRPTKYHGKTVKPLCPICKSLQLLSRKIERNSHMIIVSKSQAGALPLPGQKYLVTGDQDELAAWMQEDIYVRSYSQNQSYLGEHSSTRILVGNYSSGWRWYMRRGKTDVSQVGFLRADVDDLGNAFVNGFYHREGKSYENLLRTAILSRQISTFFQYYINALMMHGQTRIVSYGGSRRVNIIYSGGDDLFLYGQWNDVLDAFIDIRSAMRRYTQGTMSISGGIGLFTDEIPVSWMAERTSELEYYAKNNPRQLKNSIALFDEKGCYNWDVFLENVIDEKYKEIKEFYSVGYTIDTDFLPNLLNVLRETGIDRDANGQGGRFNRARFIYYLASVEPLSSRWKGHYQRFAQKMYQWTISEEDRRQLITAMELFILHNRRG